VVRGTVHAVKGRCRTVTDEAVGYTPFRAALAVSGQAMSRKANHPEYRRKPVA